MGAHEQAKEEIIGFELSFRKLWSDFNRQILKILSIVCTWTCHGFLNVQPHNVVAGLSCATEVSEVLISESRDYTDLRLIIAILYQCALTFFFLICASVLFNVSQFRIGL